MLCTRGNVLTTVYTDQQSTFKSMTKEFAGAVIYMDRAVDYVAQVDVKLQRIKEMYRSMKRLALQLPVSKVKDLVAYVVSCMNIHRTNLPAENACPRVLFTGV